MHPRQARATQALRDEGHTGDLALTDAEPHLPYNLPPLPKSALTRGTNWVGWSCVTVRSS
ncbi:hypothetical protein [Actinomadura sp. SCN-SB]|uniref:hypothetical protein n=1 Tax=Actinomadura sp. SCN-SB TaxID=3373092 RepID=UPI00375116CB